jgi:hypothetical protein
MSNFCPRHRLQIRLDEFLFFFFENSSIFALWGPQSGRHLEVTVELGGNFEDYKLVYIRFLSCHLFGPVNHGQTWKGWERNGEKGLIISDNQAQLVTWLIITINDTSIGDLPLIITISDTCKNQPKRLDFDNTINLSSLIVILVTLACVCLELSSMKNVIGNKDVYGDEIPCHGKEGM